MSAHYTRVELVEQRAPPLPRGGALQALRHDYFGSIGASVQTLALVALIGWCAVSFLRWGVFSAVFETADRKAALAACRAAADHGACWPVVVEKARLILFGLYPRDLQWRPALACVLLVLLYALSGWRRSWHIRDSTLSMCFIMSRNALLI